MNYKKLLSWKVVTPVLAAIAAVAHALGLVNVEEAVCIVDEFIEQVEIESCPIPIGEPNNSEQ